MSWKNQLGATAVEFVESIIEQIPEEHGARTAFEAILQNLADSVDDETEFKLRKLNALENNGVDNWEWYDDAMQELQDEDEEDEDE